MFFKKEKVTGRWGVNGKWSFVTYSQVYGIMQFSYELQIIIIWGFRESNKLFFCISSANLFFAMFSCTVKVEMITGIFFCLPLRELKFGSYSSC